MKTPEERYYWKFVGVLLLAAAAFFSVALATFQAGDVSANLIGVCGHMVAHGGYWAFGLAIWCLPLALVIGGIKLLEPIPDDVEEISNGRIVVRVLGHLLMVVVVTGLFQLTGRWDWVQRLLSAVGVGADAGGWVGRTFMTLGLERAIAAFGAAFLSVGLLAVALCMALGVRTFRKIFSWHLPDLSGWFSDFAESIEEGADIIRDKATKHKKTAEEKRILEQTSVVKNVFSPASWERFKSRWEKGWNARRKKPPRSESCGGFKFP